MISPMPRRLMPMYFSGLNRSGTSGSTNPSTQPIKVQISQIVRLTGAMTTMPVKNDALSPAKGLGLRA